MAVWEVPLANTPQNFSVTLGGARLQFTTAWRNTGGSGWVIDIADGNKVGLVSGLPLVTGTDLLGQHQHLGIPGQLWVQTDSNPDAVPTFDNLGITSHLYWVG